MKINNALDELSRFQKALSQGRPDMSFQIEIVPSWEGPFGNWFRKEVPGQNASRESGVYFIAHLDETILYIGKAAADNLGAEIWSKFGAATNLDNNGNVARPI